MARFVTGLAVVVTSTLVYVAPAQAAKYQGVIKGEPEASLSLTVKNIEGDRYVTRVGFRKIPVQCDNGEKTTRGNGSAGGPGSPGIEIEGGKFSGPWAFGEIDGKARGGGKLAGTFSLESEQDPPLGECESGKLDYVVQD